MLSDWSGPLTATIHPPTGPAHPRDAGSSSACRADFEGAYKGPAVTQYLIKPGYVERPWRASASARRSRWPRLQPWPTIWPPALAVSACASKRPSPAPITWAWKCPTGKATWSASRNSWRATSSRSARARLLIALGEDVKGQPVITDMARMPHLLIAGATGSGKSVCINAIITGLLLTHTPDTLRLLMVDPKMVELSVYNGVPHLLSPVVTEVDKAAAVLYWAVKEMERRYSLLSKVNARDLERYNEYLLKRGEKRLPYIVVVVDEMA
ncbi:MAG: FtsK/SpoIIIE domain-containing protein [Caldilineaceae bacterium]